MEIDNYGSHDYTGDDNSDVDDDTPSTDTKSNPRATKIPCKHCNKMISKHNMTTHWKRCKILQHESKKVNEHHLLDIIERMKGQIHSKDADIISLEKQLRVADQRLSDSDAKFEQLLHQVIIIKREGPSATDLKGSPLQVA